MLAHEVINNDKFDKNKDLQKDIILILNHKLLLHKMHISDIFHIEF